VNLLVAPPSEDDDPLFRRTVILIVDREPNGITAGVVLNRPLDRLASDVSALALVYLPDAGARAFWGGPMGEDPSVLAEFTSLDALEWFHLSTRARRPFPLPGVGVISLGEHPDVFDGRIRRARLFVGLCVWDGGQLEQEISAGQWRVANPEADDVFTPEPDQLWQAVWSRATAH
jgi:putative transcriptional regulator